MKRRVLSLVLSVLFLIPAGVRAVAAEPAAEPAAEEAAEEPYESPVDFEELQKTNPDIYAWLKIEDTVIDYPIVQNPELDRYYLHHDSERNIDLDGAIFSEATYNLASFPSLKDTEDPDAPEITEAPKNTEEPEDEKEPQNTVVVLYGHNMKSGNMFGTLRWNYTDPDFFDEHKDITVYTPEEELTYKVFAAVPYSNEHLLYQHDFTEEKEYDNFFEGVFNIRDLSAQFDEENKPVFGDHVLILSTCISGTNLRFLVMATLEPDLENRSES